MLLDVGVIETKSGSEFLGTVRPLGCNALGIVKSMKLANKIDIDPIYYCEIISLCPGHHKDRLAKESSFLSWYEAQKLGIYVDPDCDPTEGRCTMPNQTFEPLSILEQCEQWLAGTYHVTIQLCDGNCGSHHPHSTTYDIIKGTFILLDWGHFAFIIVSHPMFVFQQREKYRIDWRRCTHHQTGLRSRNDRIGKMNREHGGVLLFPPAVFAAHDFFKVLVAKENSRSSLLKK